MRRFLGVLLALLRAASAAAQDTRLAVTRITPRSGLDPELAAPALGPEQVGVLLTGSC